jgi:hypothetical protein
LHCCLLIARKDQKHGISSRVFMYFNSNVILDHRNVCRRLNLFVCKPFLGRDLKLAMTQVEACVLLFGNWFLRLEICNVP